MTSDAISEQEFDHVADATLRALERALDEADDELEVDLSSGVLTLEFSGGARYVVNSHRAARQIWMAAESSAWHFDYVASTKEWRATKSGDELWSTLAAVIGKKLGHDITLRA
jgi:CyaY protein